MVQWILAGVAASALITPAADGAARYGDRLLTREARLHSHIRYAAIDITGPPAPATHFETGSRQVHSRDVALPLVDGLGDRIGTLTLQFSDHASSNEAQPVARELSRRIYAPAVLGEPDPFVAGGFHSTSGQALVERELAKEPGLVTIALHVALPGRDNEIIASNFGRIGKAADKDDLHVISDSAVLQEETNAGRRRAVELPLLDRRGRVIGALSTSFLTGSDGKEGAYRSALRVQQDLSRRIPRLESLAE